MSRPLPFVVVFVLGLAVALPTLPGCKSAQKNTPIATSAKKAHACPKCGQMTINADLCERCLAYSGSTAK
jgi:predicted RNA-binding Zn-ribbon protein involved in translation (DUF1610 family)